MEKPLPSKPPALSSSHDFIAQTLSPVIAVTASEDADALCRLNHIPSVTDFLKPFGEPVEGRVTPRDWQGVPIPIDQFTLRFKAVHKLDEPNHQGVMKMVEDKVKRYSIAQQENMNIRTKQDVSEDYLNTPLDQLTPWYIDFKKTLLSLRGITEYETFDHPVATMVVISSANTDPINTIMQLYNPNIPSFTVDRPYVDTNVLRYYVVLHDPNTTSDEQANALFDKLKRTVGLHCYLLRINSKPRKPDNGIDDNDEPKAEETIQSIWNTSIAETYKIESELQSFAVDNSTETSSISSSSISNINTSSAMPTVQNTPDRVSSPISINSPNSMSPSSSPSHSRANSIISSNSQQTVPASTTMMQGTSIQSVPVYMEENDNPTEETHTQTEDVNQKEQKQCVQYGCYLTIEDVQNVKSMIREFVAQSLLPFMERNIQQWNEQIAAPRRGLTGRLFGASRRLFGSNSRSFSSHQQPSVQFLPVNHQTNSNIPHGVHQLLVYPYTTPEAQLRKLADYAFMLRDYKFAYTIYDTVRRDFATEKAYAYHAGTLEMMGICQLFMMANSQSSQGFNNSTSSLSSINSGNSSSNKGTLDIASIDRHLELAIQQYLTRCRLPYYATRTTIIYYELLKTCEYWKEIPAALVRMTGEDWDVRSGLFLEQAAHAFLKRKRRHGMASANTASSKRKGLRTGHTSGGNNGGSEGRGDAMVRKYAFHLVMAGHRYGKAMQRTHAYRCYQLASYIFPTTTIANDSIISNPEEQSDEDKEKVDLDAHKYQNDLRNKGWSVAQSHIQFALGRQAFHLGQLEEAVHYFANVLSDSSHLKSTNEQQQSNSVQQQMAHIREFLFIYKQYVNSKGIEDPTRVSLLPADILKLPIIDCQKGIKVTLSNKQHQQQQQLSTTAETQATNLSDEQEMWAQMELDLLENSIANGFISSSKRSMAVQQQDDQRIVCAVGEPTIVHIQLYNPLQIAIQLSDLMLGCHYKKMDTPDEVDNERVTQEADHTSIMPEGKQNTDDADMFEFENYNLQKIHTLTLEPLEKTTISLAIVPRHEGSVQVEGLHYTLNELVHMFKPFHKRGKRLNRTKEESMSVVYAKDRSMDILVTSPMPLLELTCHNVPEAILSGEVIQTVLEVYNKGNKGLTALRVKTSHPSFICVGNPEEMDKDIYASTTANTTFDTITLTNELFDPSVITIPLPATKNTEHNNKHGVVMPGETTLIPLWIRGDRIGKHSIKLLFSYQSDDDEANSRKNTMIAHRTLQYSLPIQVLPSLKINAFTRPSNTPTSAHESDMEEKGFILGVEIENLQTMTDFGLMQLTAASPIWQITPLNIDLASEDDVASKTTIPARQTTFAYYKITKRASTTLEDDSSSPEKWSSHGLQLFNSGELLDKKSTMEKPAPIRCHVDKVSFKTNCLIPFDSTPLESFALNARMQWRQNNLEGLYPHVPHDLYSQLFTLYNTGDIDLSLYWEASPTVAPAVVPSATGATQDSSTVNESSSSTNKRRGHHYIIGINLAYQDPAVPVTNSETSNTVNSIMEQSLFDISAKERSLLLQSLMHESTVA